MFIKTVFFATLCFWGAVFSLLPVISIHVSNNAQSNSTLNLFIESNQEALLSIGTLLLISLLAIIQVYIGNRSSEAREQANRAIQGELKIAEFREKWISEIRQELAEYYFLASEDRETRDHREFGKILTKIRVRLNLEEPLANNLYRTMLKVSDYLDDLDPRQKGIALSEFGTASHDFLRNEWKRLKLDIKNSDRAIGASS